MTDKNEGSIVLVSVVVSLFFGSRSSINDGNDCFYRLVVDSAVDVDDDYSKELRELKVEKMIISCIVSTFIADESTKCDRHGMIVMNKKIDLILNL